LSFRKDLLRSAIFVGVITFAVFARVLTCDFINYDDLDYVTENSLVQKGVTREGLSWAFGNLHGKATYWHPLTWISHMVDCQVFGVNPWGHHLGNLLFHTANAVLVFLVFSRLTGMASLSMVASLFFALHPLQVDTVAWVSERKNILSVFFALLSILAYSRYAEKRRLIWYALALIGFGASLMSKPSLVIMPCVFLLLDFWPLQRLSLLDSRFAWRGMKLMAEKLPFFALSAGSALVTVLGHEELGIVTTGGAFSLSNRIQNAIVSYGRYLKKIVYPDDLAIFYPHPGQWPAAVIFGTGLLLVLLTAGAFLQRKKRPWLLVGWLWFLGSLVPTLGIIQVGPQSMADRFVYFPMIGISIALVWGANELSEGYGLSKWINMALSCAVLGLLTALSFRQIGYWKTSRTLWQHALDVTPRNYIACNNLAEAWVQEGQPARALPLVNEAIQRNPIAVEAWCHRGNIYRDLGRSVEALTNYSVAARLAPRWPDVPLLMGQVEEARSNWQPAIEHYQRAVDLDPKSVPALNNLSWLLATAPDAGQRDGRRAVQAALKAAELTSYRMPMVLGTLAAAYAENGQFKEAIDTAGAAIAIANASGNRALAERNIELRELYSAQKPFHQKG